MLMKGQPALHGSSVKKTEAFVTSAGTEVKSYSLGLKAPTIFVVTV